MLPPFTDGQAEDLRALSDPAGIGSVLKVAVLSTGPLVQWNFLWEGEGAQWWRSICFPTWTKTVPLKAT